MTDWDADGYAIPGTYPISEVFIAGWGPDGTPHPTVRSAICDVCGGWASNLWTTVQSSTKDDSQSDIRVSRRLEVTVYACPEHSDQVSDSLMEEFGAVFNTYEADDLAKEVDKTQRMHGERTP